MPERNRDPAIPEAGEQVPPRRHDAGSGANETIDGLDATTEETAARCRRYAFWSRSRKDRENPSLRPRSFDAENLAITRRVLTAVPPQVQTKARRRRQRSPFRSDLERSGDHVGCRWFAPVAAVP